MFTCLQSYTNHVFTHVGAIKLDQSGPNHKDIGRLLASMSVLCLSGRDDQTLSLLEVASEEPGRAMWMIKR